MNTFKNSKLVLIAVASAIAFSSGGAIAAESYGRAGGTVGADRVQQLAGVKADPASQTADTSTWYGRAGGPVGVESIVARVSTPKAYAAGQVKTPVVYGRAGVPLPFGG
jgi:hypothetical protein